MSEPQSNQTKLLSLLCATMTVSAIVFGALWLQNGDGKQKVAVTEIEKPVQVIKQVEVPAKLTGFQLAAIDFFTRNLEAKFAVEPDASLFKLDSVDVTVSFTGAVKDVVSEDRVRNKLELILRTHGVKIDEKSSALLQLSITGFWGKDTPLFVYHQNLALDELVTVEHKGEFRRVVATLWRVGTVGLAGKDRAEGEILGLVESQGESFANKFLAAQEKNK